MMFNRKASDIYIYIYIFGGKIRPHIWWFVDGKTGEGGNVFDVVGD